MRRRLALRLFVSIAIVGLGAAACTTPDPVTRFPDLRFTHLSPIALDVSTIEVVSTYEPPFKDPNVEHLMPVSPEKAARNWAEDRLTAAGDNGYIARFVIANAATVAEALPTTGGVKGMVTTDQSEKFTATLDVAVELVAPSGQMMGSATANAWISRTVAEDASLADREKVWFAMIEDLMKAIDPTLEKSIRRHLKDSVVN